MVSGVETSGVRAAGASYLRVLEIHVALLVVGVRCSGPGAGVVVLLTQSDRDMPLFLLTDVRPTLWAWPFARLLSFMLSMFLRISSAVFPERHSQVSGKGSVTTSDILQCCGSSADGVSDGADFAQ
jgi:hypothetical protein